MMTTGIGGGGTVGVVSRAVVDRVLLLNDVKIECPRMCLRWWRLRAARGRGERCSGVNAPYLEAFDADDKSDSFLTEFYEGYYH